MTDDERQTRGRVTGVEWGGIELENQHMTKVAPAFITVRLDAKDLAGIDITRPITITQEED